MKKALKSFILITVILVVIIIALNFIPVKFAYKPNKGDIIYNDTCKIGKGVGDDATNTNGFEKRKYGVVGQQEPYVLVEISGNTPYSSLDKETFDKSSLFEKYFERDNGDGIIEDTTNFYVFQGKTVESRNDGAIFVVDKIKVEHWDIVYPIQRNGFRRHITPTSYLTLYDYEWFSKIAVPTIKILLTMQVVFFVVVMVWLVVRKGIKRKKVF